MSIEMKKVIIVLLLSMSSCVTELPTVPELFINIDDLDNRIADLTPAAKNAMNGIYEVLDGEKILGDSVVGKWINKRWCLYCKHDVVFSENAGGSLGDSLLFTGFIRVVRSGSGMKIDLTVLPEEGGSELSEGVDSPAVIILRGLTSDGDLIHLKRTRSLYQPSDQREFHILAHRGGGRNSERLGISENSIDMLLHAEIFGATGVEIDVKQTRDGKLILFHDDTFSPRTVLGAYLLGKVENFDLKQIKLFGRLVNGEPIPTLREALTAIIERTNLSLVWLDIKDPSVVSAAIDEQAYADSIANSIGRNIEILVGAPSEKILEALQASPNVTDKSKILIELGSEIFPKYKLNYRAWAPRWTNNPSAICNEIPEMKKDNILTFTWTLDVQDFIPNYMNCDIDGILSNYPSLLAGMYYSRQPD